MPSRKAHPHTPESRAKIGARLRGRVFTPDTIAKMRAAATLRWSSPEARARQRVAIDPLQMRAIANALPILGECVYCFGPAQARDHVIPRGRPGWEDPENAVLACRACNSSKGNRTPEEWFLGS